jgi:hypothetical protein
VQPADAGVNEGASVLALCRLAAKKGYELIATTTCNALFVDRALYPRFGITDNCLEALRQDTSGVTHLFYGYDGQVRVAGNKRLIWHDVPFAPERLQQIPWFFRQYPGNYSPLKQWLWRYYQRMRR